MKNVWIADDGKIFDTKEECAEYEGISLKKVIVKWLNSLSFGAPDFLFISEDGIPFISHHTDEIADKMIPTLEEYAENNADEENCGTPCKLFRWCINNPAAGGFGDMFQIFRYDDEMDAFFNTLPEN